MSLKVVYPNLQKQVSQEYKQQFLYKSLIRALGFTAAESAISYICVTTNTPKSEFLSDYETFSKLITQVYGGAGQRLVLDKLLDK